MRLYASVAWLEVSVKHEVCLWLIVFVVQFAVSALDLKNILDVSSGFYIDLIFFVFLSTSLCLSLH